MEINMAEKTKEQKILASKCLNKKITRVWIEFSLDEGLIKHFGDSEMKNLLTNPFKFGGGNINIEFNGNSSYSILRNHFPPIISLFEYEPLQLETPQERIYSFEISDPKSGEPFFAKEILNHNITSIDFLYFIMPNVVTVDDVGHLLKISPALAKYRKVQPRVGILFTLDSGFQFIAGIEISATNPVFSIFTPAEINKELEKYIVKESIL
ncbi:MAG: hypothetical protein IT236_07825 [Bacteroidia bacterium]|nr:hypothetical protein [Bacteroidia bacterium]